MSYDYDKEWSGPDATDLSYSQSLDFRYLQQYRASIGLPLLKGDGRDVKRRDWDEKRLEWDENGTDRNGAGPD